MRQYREDLQNGIDGSGGRWAEGAHQQLHRRQLANLLRVAVAARRGEGDKKVAAIQEEEGKARLLVGRRADAGGDRSNNSEP